MYLFMSICYVHEYVAMYLYLRLCIALLDNNIKVKGLYVHLLCTCTSAPKYTLYLFANVSLSCVKSGVKISWP